ncbi:MAG: 6-phosphogluconolactonase [Verrucomicrobia bacterium]|nr:6-phosphogluconolactonase [Verrucomicrobiota bacterium]MBS0637674.1 6-phosphogluconolactonase [Verrucomicrobiota bacterium]
MRSLISLDSEEKVIDFCIVHFVDEANFAIDTHGNFTVALSGGSTPKKFYEALTQSEEAKALDWSKICLFWSDERACKPTDADSNYGMAMKYFSKAPFNKAKAFRMEAEREDRDEAAREYANLIQEHAAEGKLDLCYLGLGEDGHTASLFPGTEALKIKDRLVVANYVPSLKTWRMTMTFPCINSSRNIVLIATGAKKQKILHEVLESKDQTLYPAQAIQGKETPAFIVTDSF